jgi:hypothetical protein
MVIGLGVIELWIAESRSLKDKRAVLRSMLKRAQNEFNLSIAEVGDNDHLRRAKIGFAFVGNDQRVVNAKIDHLLTFIAQMQLAEVVRTKIEITGFSGLMDGFDIPVEKYDDV